MLGECHVGKTLVLYRSQQHKILETRRTVIVNEATRTCQRYDQDIITLFNTLLGYVPTVRLEDQRIRITPTPHHIVYIRGGGTGLLCRGRN